MCVVCVKSLCDPASVLGVEASCAYSCFDKGPASFAYSHRCPSWAVRGEVAAVVTVELVFGSACVFQMLAYSAVRVVSACLVGLEPFRGDAVVCANRYGGAQAVAGFAYFGPDVALEWCT